MGKPLDSFIFGDMIMITSVSRLGTIEYEFGNRLVGVGDILVVFHNSRDEKFLALGGKQVAGTDWLEVYSRYIEAELLVVIPQNSKTLDLWREGGIRGFRNV